MGNLTFIKTEIDGVFIIETKVFGDERGYFTETYKRSDFEDAGLYYEFVQDNQSRSKKGVLRGLHFQKKHPQAKLVRVIEGEVYDVVVDLRSGSKMYGKWVGTTLSADNHRQLLVPRGFAHGFLVLSDCATLCYKCDDFYHSEDEGGILWSDPEIGIKWPFTNDLILSDKDKQFPLLKDVEVVF